MNIQDLKQLREATQMTNAEIAELSSIPIEVVDKIFSGEIEEPKYATLLAIEQVLVRKEKIPFYYDTFRQEPCLIRDESVAYKYNARKYTMKDIEQLSEGMMVELINGKLHFITAPSRMHQFLVTNILVRMFNHIKEKQGNCHVYPAPLGVCLLEEDETFVLPDIVLVCKKDVLTDAGCEGAPDLLVEIVSPGNASHDYITKLAKYKQIGVREYWIVDPLQKKVSLVNYEDSEESGEYSYKDVIRSCVLEGFEIRIADFIEKYDSLN